MPRGANTSIEPRRGGPTGQKGTPRREPHVEMELLFSTWCGMDLAVAGDVVPEREYIERRDREDSTILQYCPRCRRECDFLRPPKKWVRVYL